MTSSFNKDSASARGFHFQNVYWLWLSALVMVLDQTSKQLIVDHLGLFNQMPLTSWLNVTLMHNTGAAFSIFTSATPWLFITLSIVVAIGILIWLRRHPQGDRLVAISLSLILGGALGNAIDRATRGFVVDFIDFHYHGWHYPAFNLADSAIVLGAILLFLDMLRPARKPVERKGRADRGDTDRR